jgi:hypothetical protein
VEHVPFVADLRGGEHVAASCAVLALTAAEDFANSHSLVEKLGIAFDVIAEDEWGVAWGVGTVFG